MPELPEVETIRRSLEEHLVGCRVQSVTIRLPKMLRGQNPVDFRKQLQDARLEQAERRAKYLLLGFKGKVLLLHLGMSGQILLQGPKACPMPETLPDKHTHLIIRWSRGWTLYFRDPRQFGRFQVLTNRQAEEFLTRFGPEPLGPVFTLHGFGRALARRKTSIKAALLNQAVVAGIGNIYADESLFYARISPYTTAAQLGAQPLHRLYQAIRTVLKRAVRLRGTSISDFCDPFYRPGGFQKVLQVYGREGKPCLVCGHLIQKSVLAQRGTHWCPHCQKLGASAGKRGQEGEAQ